MVGVVGRSYSTMLPYEFLSYDIEIYEPMLICIFELLAFKLMKHIFIIIYEYILVKIMNYSFHSTKLCFNYVMDNNQSKRKIKYMNSTLSIT